jgi:hypothetical protein
MENLPQMVQGAWYVLVDTLCRHLMSLTTRITDTDILYLNVAGTSLVVLDSSEAAMELLEKRSSIYSGRSLLFLNSFRCSLFIREAERACRW